MHRISLLALALCLAAPSASAESFVERMARQAAEKMAQKATDRILNGSDDSGQPQSDDEDGQVLTPKPRASTTTNTATPVPAPAPKPKPKREVPPHPGMIAVTPEIKAQKEAFDLFGRVHCSDCEGGYDYDSWAQRFFGGELAGEYNGWAKKLGNLDVGQRLTWKGKASNGSLTVVSENPVDGFRCKQLTYRLDKGRTSAERPGLVCWGLLNEYASKETWVIVY